MSINLSTVDADFFAYYKSSIHSMSEGELISGSRKMPDLMRGLKQDKPNVDQLRERVLAKLQLKSVPPPVLEIVRAATLADGLIVVLSDKALNQGLTALFERFGRVPILASMLLDDRDSVRENAHVEAVKLSRGDVKIKNGETFNQRFKPLIDVMRPVIQDIPYQAPVNATLQRVVSQQTLTKEQLEREIHSSSIFKQLLRERNQLDGQCKNLTVENVNLKKELTLNKILVNDLNKSVREDESQRERRIAEGIADGINNRISSWLIQSEIMIHSGLESSNAMHRASELLVKQAKLDKRFGTRTAIHEEIQEARRLQGLLRTALAESIQPLPNLFDEIKALANHIHDLEALLSKSSLTPSAPELVQLNEELQLINEMTLLLDKKIAVEQTMSFFAWSKSLCKQAYELIDRRAMLIYMAAQPKDIGSKNELPPVTVSQYFEFGIRTAKACRLMIDGHNLLPKIKPLIGKEYFTEGQGPNSLARALLIEKVRTLSDLHPLISADIWFDGPDDQDWTETNNLRVWFSGGKGADRADGRILESLQAQSYMENKNLCFLVTEDRDLLNKALKLGAHGLSPLEFWTMVA